MHIRWVQSRQNSLHLKSDIGNVQSSVNRGTEKRGIHFNFCMDNTHAFLRRFYCVRTEWFWWAATKNAHTLQTRNFCIQFRDFYGFISGSRRGKYVRIFVEKRQVKKWEKGANKCRKTFLGEKFQRLLHLVTKRLPPFFRFSQAQLWLDNTGQMPHQNRGFYSSHKHGHF